jgi:hypothetical protein
MRVLKATLLAEGSSDRALVPILKWFVEDALRRVGSVASRFEIAFTTEPPATSGLADRVARALRGYPCDLLFVHRDEDGKQRDTRVAEISLAVTSVSKHVPVVPVRMTEAWLLCDEMAIRLAADNPNGQEPLGLPKPAMIERLPDPKRTLREALISASGKRGRRLSMFERDIARRVHRVAELITDYSVLRALPAFALCEADTRAAIAAHGPW